MSAAESRSPSEPPTYGAKRRRRRGGTAVVNDPTDCSSSHDANQVVGHAFPASKDAMGRFVSKMSQCDACVSRNMQRILYLIAVFGSWGMVFAKIYPLVEESEYVKNYHKKLGYLVFCLCVTSWRLACCVGPGNITEASMRKFDNYEYDNLLYRKKICPTLHIRKLARSKYDRYTDQHVPRFDHYCTWLNQSIGEENYRFFLLFLVVHTGMCYYGSVIMFQLLWGKIFESRLLTTVLMRRLIAFAYVLSCHLIMSGLFLFLVGMSLFLTSFLGFHLYIISKGMTTNEFMKWREIKEMVKDANRRSMQERNSGKRNDNGLTSPRIGNGFAGDQDVEEANKSKGAFTPINIPRNIYDLGIISNFAEVIFPRSLRFRTQENHATKNV